jgi:hypothetical protein
MPATAIERHELQYLAITPDKKMGAHLKIANARKIRMLIPVKLVQKQLLNLWPTELARRQAY